MGLTAVVYRSRDTLCDKALAAPLQYDPTTGEYWVEGPNARVAYPREMFFARYEELGTLSDVIAARKELREHGLPAAEPIIRMVLYSGIHGGDLVDLASVESLHCALEATIRVEHRWAPVTTRILGQLFVLVAKAKMHLNPIVFL
jgi:hypothetical protein